MPVPARRQRGRAAALFLALWPAPGAAACAQALAVGLDVSGSVNEAEYVLQTGGLAAALLSPEVRRAIAAEPGRNVWLSVYDWSGPEHRRTILPWTEIADELALELAAAQIAATPRAPGPPLTAVGSAMLYGAALLAERAECPRLTLDLTGDGISNAGPRPRDVALEAGGVPVTVNALVIGAELDPSWDGGEPGTAQLKAWFEAEVIRGPDAFVETARGFSEFEEAMIRKLLRELPGAQVSALEAD